MLNRGRVGRGYGTCASEGVGVRGRRSSAVLVEISLLRRLTALCTGTSLQELELLLLLE